MSKYTHQAAIDALKNMDDEKLIDLWNECCTETRADDYVSILNEDFIDEHFTKPSEAVRAAIYGEFSWADKYIYLDGYANLQTFDYLDSEKSPIDFDALLDWLERTMDAEGLAELLELKIDENREDF